ncbi:MAG: gliding motility lipoprotein GldB [Ichthyobacteriaceae bacterium]|nr:gliding motility lipoprotein GldB [Ichthyobacteriaceae bacterium]
MKKIIIASVFALLLAGCTDSEQVDVSDITINSKLIRFDSLFYNSNSANLKQIQQNFPKMVNADVADTVWLNKINNKHEIDVYNKSVAVFGDFKHQSKEIENVFKHIKYYFPKFNEPDVLTVISDFDYQYPVLYSGKKLFISLDMYLGADEEEYQQFPLYLTSNMTKERIKVDVSDVILRTIVGKDPYDKSFLSNIIYQGKLLYLSQKMTPQSTESLIIGYTPEQIKWCKANESYMWSYFVQKKTIYSTNKKLSKRFIEVAPFSKFYLDLDRKSPGRVGTWIGWQIVNSYMENTNTTLEELALNTDARKIFMKSKYKPKR